MPFYDIMTDIETTGTRPDRHHVMSLAGVAFNWFDGTICAEDQFYVTMEMPGWRGWDEDTRDWWSRQSPETFAAAVVNPVPLAVGMQLYRDWVRRVTGALEPPRLWAKPISFEWPFIESCFRDANVQNPFFFRDAIDMQSFIRGMRMNPAAQAFDKQVPFVGREHHALDDTLHQVAVALTAKAKFATTPKEQTDG